MTLSAQPRSLLSPRVLGILLGWFLIPVGSAFAQGTGEPIPAERYARGRFVCDLDNFTIAHPGENWVWHQVRYQTGSSIKTTYVCTDTVGGTQFFVLPMGPMKELIQGSIDEFRAGVADSVAQQGWTLRDFRQVASSVPYPGGHRFSFRIEAAERPAFYVHGYLTRPAAETYALQCRRSASGEPPEFRNFVSSFQVIRKRPPAKQEPPAEAFVILAFVLIGICLLLQAIVNAITGRPFFNGGLVATFLIAAFALTRLTFGFIAVVRGSLPDEQAAYEIGKLLGEGLIPLAIALTLAKNFNKRAQENTPKQDDPPEGNFSE